MAKIISGTARRFRADFDAFFAAYHDAVTFDPVAETALAGILGRLDDLPQEARRSVLQALKPAHRELIAAAVKNGPAENAFYGEALRAINILDPTRRDETARETDALTSRPLSSQIRGPLTALLLAPPPYPAATLMPLKTLRDSDSAEYTRQLSRYLRLAAKHHEQDLYKQLVCLQAGWSEDSENLIIAAKKGFLGLFIRSLSQNAQTTARPDTTIRNHGGEVPRFPVTGLNEAILAECIPILEQILMEGRFSAKEEPDKFSLAGFLPNQGSLEAALETRNMAVIRIVLKMEKIADPAAYPKKLARCRRVLQVTTSTPSFSPSVGT